MRLYQTSGFTLTICFDGLQSITMKGAIFYNEDEGEKKRRRI